MIFDGLITVLCCVLVVNGWSRGLLRSWRGPLAMIAATLIVQRLYIDFSAWMAYKMRLHPADAVVLGYLMLWLSIESVLELALSMMFKIEVKNTPLFFDRVGGAAYGLLKSLVIVLLPLMAISVGLNISEPPADRSGLQLPEFPQKYGLLVPCFIPIAHKLLADYGGYVVSHSSPTFSASYESIDLNADDDSDQEDKATIAKHKLDLEKMLK